MRGGRRERFIKKTKKKKNLKEVIEFIQLRFQNLSS